MLPSQLVHYARLNRKCSVMFRPARCDIVSATTGPYMAVFRFGSFELDTQTGELRKRGLRLRLNNQSCRIMTALLKNPGQVISRDELKQQIWPDGTYVDFDRAINKAMSQLRAVTGDSASAPRYFETLSKRGYRFIGVLQDPVPSLNREIRVLLVLPFANLSGQAAYDWVADLMTEAVITSVASATTLVVMSRTTTMSCKSVRKPLDALACELGIDAAVEGSISSAGPWLRATVRFIRTDGERLIWQHGYDLPSDSGIANMARDVGSHIGVHTKSSRPGAKLVQEDTPAHRAYARGRYLWQRRTAPGLYGSLQHFQKASEADSRFALAYAGISDAWLVLGMLGLEPSQIAFSNARSSAQCALELEDSLAEAHNCLAEIRKAYDRDWDGAERQYRHAIALDSGCATAHHFYAQLLLTLGRHAEAVDEIEEARRAAPLSPAINAYLPYVYLAAGQYEIALREAELAVELDPHIPLAHWNLGRACLFSGQNSRALQCLDRAADLAGPSAFWQSELAFARARNGDHEGARRILKDLIAESQHTYVSPYDLALIFAGLGERELALDRLEQCAEERVSRVTSLGDPEFYEVRGEPRYRRLLDRLRLPHPT